MVNDLTETLKQSKQLNILKSFDPKYKNTKVTDQTAIKGSHLYGILDKYTSDINKDFIPELNKEFTKWNNQLGEQGKSLQGNLDKLNNQLIEQGKSLQGNLDKLNNQLIEQGKSLQGNLDKLNNQLIEQGKSLQGNLDKLNNQLGEQGKSLQGNLDKLQQRLEDLERVDELDDSESAWNVPPQFDVL